MKEGDSGARVFVCLDDDSRGLSAALALMARRRRGAPAIVVRMAQDAGLAVLLKGMGGAEGAGASLRAFGLLDRTIPTRSAGRERDHGPGDPRGLSAAAGSGGGDSAQNASLVPWDALPADLREANREQAADIGVKLRAVGCGVAPALYGDEPGFKFAPEEVELLAAWSMTAGWRRRCATAGNTAR
ncbi:MAG: hypothetical protein U1F77_19585 [Kiritimatiellia bacterium]